MNPNASSWQPQPSGQKSGSVTAALSFPHESVSKSAIQGHGKSLSRRTQARKYQQVAETASLGGKKDKKKGQSRYDKKLAMQMFTYEDVGKGAEERDTSSTAWSAPKGSSHLKYRGPKMTRAQYCLANNRFVLSPTMDESNESLYNPDVGLPWECVESVSSSENEVKCSICLGTLSLPVVTVCGHVFCRICALRYLFYDSESSHIPPSQKCPLCNSHISLRDLRAFSFAPLPIAPAGFRFRLMCMQRGSMFAQMQPCSVTNENKQDKSRQKVVASGIPRQCSDDARFSRVVMSTAESVLRQIAEERASLLAFHQACIRAGRSETSMFDVDSQADVEYLPAIAQALTLLQERQERALASAGQAAGEPPLSLYSPSPSVASLLATSAEEVEKILNPDFPALGAESVGKDKAGAGSEIRAASGAVEEAVPVPLVNENGVYFYQCDSGALVFLHPICMKALLTDAANRVKTGEDKPEAKTLPSLLSSFAVLEQESVRIDASVRSRIPYVRHLPEHCDLVYLIEIDLASIVLPETYALFADELQKRRQRRKKAKQVILREKRDDLDREIARNLQREEMRERHRELLEKEALDLEELKSGPQAGKGDEENEEWPSGGISAVVESHGEVHSYKNISTTMGFFPELGSKPPPPTAGAWVMPARSRGSSCDIPISQSSSQPKGGKKSKGEKIDLVFSFT
jgi:hypothetical protein